MQWTMPHPEPTTGSLRTRTPITDLLRTLEARREVTVQRRDDYVTLRAGESSSVAIFAHADRVAIAVAPAKGYEVEHRTPFTRQIPRTPVVAYVIVTANEVRAHFDEVRDLALESLDWRSCGRTPEVCARCGVGCSSWLDTCPNCWVEIDAAGRCGCIPQPPAQA